MQLDPVTPHVMWRKTFAKPPKLNKKTVRIYIGFGCDRLFAGCSAKESNSNNGPELHPRHVCTYCWKLCAQQAMTVKKAEIQFYRIEAV